VPSKKRSVAKPPEEEVFFLDRSLGVEPIRSVLTREGLVVEIHDNHFKRDEEDRVWLAKVGSRNWVVLTKDQRLRYRPLEIAALRVSRCRVFVLVAGNMKGDEIASIFVKSLHQIFAILRSHPGPFVARISKGGRVAI
jgi:predicted nuclease of predicted toxin-antitoxin system